MRVVASLLWLLARLLAILMGATAAEAMVRGWIGPELSSFALGQFVGAFACLALGVKAAMSLIGDGRRLLARSGAPV